MYMGNRNLIKIASILPILGISIILLIRSNDYRNLKRKSTVVAVAYTYRRITEEEHKKKSKEESREVVLREKFLREVVLRPSWPNIKYRLTDSPEDGYFPNDSDGIIDLISKEIPPRRSTYTRERIARKVYNIPYEEELYKIGTEKFLNVFDQKVGSRDVVD